MPQCAPLVAAHDIVEQIGAHDLLPLRVAYWWCVTRIVVGIDEKTYARHFLLVLLSQAHCHTGYAIGIVLQEFEQ